MRPLQPQIFPDQKRIPLTLPAPEITHRAILTVLDRAHLTINAVLLGKVIKQAYRRLDLGLLLHRLADAQPPIVTVAVIDQSGVPASFSST